MYEISTEATLQFFLQSGVLLYKLFYTAPSQFEFMKEDDYTVELVSITTSFISILWGLSSYKINVTQREPKFLDKLVLMVRSSVDIIARSDLLFYCIKMFKNFNNLFFLSYMGCFKDNFINNLIYA